MTTASSPAPAAASTLAAIRELAADAQPKTLLQAREKFAAIAALIPAAQSVNAPASDTATRESSNPYAEKVAQLHQRETARAAAIAAGQVPADIVALAAARGVEIPKPPPSDRELLAIYGTLVGGQRKLFLAAHRDALWRAYEAQQQSRRAV